MRNLVLTGFMATGKSSVGREVARRLGRPFVDMDEEIAAQAGKPIVQIFAEEGEADFRRMEAALCAELGQREGLVIATGGGTLVDPENRARLETRSTLVCLTCDVDEVLRRAATEGPTRPLLGGTDAAAAARALIRARRPAYDAIPWQVDTTGASLSDVVERVARLAAWRTLRVRHPGGSYPVHVGAGSLSYAGAGGAARGGRAARAPGAPTAAGAALRAAGSPEGSRVAVVSNPVVAPLYAERLHDALRAAGFRPTRCTIPDGEAHKTLDTVRTLYDRLLEAGVDRSGTVVSLGGGVTGDVAGFAAATLMRGVRFAQVPTTLLAMVDASVGGKTGVDLPQGKNLVGAFKQPAMVLIDPEVLATLPEEELRSGAAEMLKHGLIADPALFAPPEAGEAITEGRIARALRVKIDIVEEDPFEGGRRAVLNLGHTVGHALERLSDYSLRHGEAVAVGMVAAARIAAATGRCAPDLPEQIAAVLAAWKLPVTCPPYPPEEIYAAMAHDKKRRGDTLRWVLPVEVGRVVLADDVPPEVVVEALRGM